MKALFILVALSLPVAGFALGKKASPFGSTKKSETTHQAEEELDVTAVDVDLPTREVAETPVKTPPKKTETPPQKTVTTAAPKKEVATAEAKVATTPSAPAPEANETSTSNTSGDIASTECKAGTDVRKIEVLEKGNGCDVAYTKFGESKSIGSALNDKSVCSNIVAKVRTNLEGSGFSCN